MATKTSAIITSVGNGNKAVSKAITDINPKADNGAIKTLCESLAGLTNNTLTGIQRVDKTDLSPTSASKEKFTLNLNETTIAGITFNTKTNAKQLSYGASTTPAFTIDYHWEDADGNTVGMVAATIIFGANWNDSTRALTVYIDTTGASAFQIVKLVADLHFAETDTTSATTYRLTVADGETTTFVQL